MSAKERQTCLAGQLMRKIQKPKLTFIGDLNFPSGWWKRQGWSNSSLIGRGYCYCLDTRLARERQVFAHGEHWPITINAIGANFSSSIINWQLMVVGSTQSPPMDGLQHVKDSDINWSFVLSLAEIHLGDRLPVFFLLCAWMRFRIIATLKREILCCKVKVVHWVKQDSKKEIAFPLQPITYLKDRNSPHSSLSPSVILQTG